METQFFLRWETRGRNRGQRVSTGFKTISLMHSSKHFPRSLVTMATTSELLQTLNDATDCASLMKKNLTEEIQEKLKDRETELGGTLGDCIRSGELGVGGWGCLGPGRPWTPGTLGAGGLGTSGT